MSDTSIGGTMTGHGSLIQAHLVDGRSPSRRWRRRLQASVFAGALGVASLGLAPAATPLSASTATGPCGSTGVFSQNGTQSTCAYTTPSQSPTTDTFTVPAGVGSVHVVAVGAAGAGSSSGSTFATGGAGAQVAADLVVSGGSVLDVDVGVGGAHGGGTHGVSGGGGGGLSGLYTSSTTATADAVVVAAGGGGAGGPGCTGSSSTSTNPPCTPSSPGDAGAGAGSGAASACNGGSEADGRGAATAQDGGGGTCSAGGAGGTGMFAGSPGSAGQGGFGGGGGGAGYLGGGGGVLPSCQTTIAEFTTSIDCNSGGGGGGGSSFAGPGTSNVAMAPGIGGPSVTVSWTDSDLGLTNIPGNVTTYATDSTGATVTYTNPTAVDDSVDNPGPTVGCSPSSGSHFVLGTTIVTCTASDSDDANGPVSASFTVTVNPAADLAIYLSATPNPVRVGGTLTYTITVQNSGPTAASSVQVSDTLPSTVQMTTQPLRQGGESGTCHAPPPGFTGTLTCALTSFASGAPSWTVTVVVKVVAAPRKGALTDTASVSSSTADPTSADNSATVTTQVK